MRTKFQRGLEFYLKQVVFGIQNLCKVYFLHPYADYANILWDSTYKTYLKRILGKQNQVARIMSSDDISLFHRGF